MIYMKVTMGGVWVLEQKTKEMKMSALWQRFLIKMMMKKTKKKKAQEEDDDEIKATNELMKELNEFFTK